MYIHTYVYIYIYIFIHRTSLNFHTKSLTDVPRSQGTQTKQKQDWIVVMAQGVNLKGKSTWNHRFSHEIWEFPVHFPLNQYIDGGWAYLFVPCIQNDNPNWRSLIFQRGSDTTNQIKLFIIGVNAGLLSVLVTPSYRLQSDSG